MVNVEELSIGYRNCSLFSSLNFRINKGEVVAVLGANGIGKSTLLRTLSGLQKPLNGIVTMNGSSIHTISTEERSKLISVVTTERLSLDSMNVYDFIALGRSPYTSWMGNLSTVDEEFIQSVIADFEILHLSARWYNWLSDGEKQLCHIARAVAQQTPLVVLDEPTAFLDYKNKRRVLQLLRYMANKCNISFLFSTHDVEVAYAQCDNVILMQQNNTVSYYSPASTPISVVTNILGA